MWHEMSLSAGLEIWSVDMVCEYLILKKNKQNKKMSNQITSKKNAIKTIKSSVMKDTKYHKKKTENRQLDKQNNCTEKSTTDDALLTRMAIEEICKETAKGAIRAEQVGPSGWLPCPLRKTNKRFLRNTIKSVICHNNNQTMKPKSDKELDEIIKRGQLRKHKFGERKHCFRRPDRDGTKNLTIKSKKTDKCSPFKHVK